MLDTEITFAKSLMGSGDYAENLRAVLTYHLIRPSFLWRLEEGEASQPNPAKVALTPYEVATRLAFQVTDSTPDQELLDAAT